MDARYFLTDKDDKEQLADFERDRDRFARQIRVRQQKNAAPQPLVSAVVDLASAYLAEQNHGFQGVAVAVEGGDGMTWSAHSVDRGIADALPEVPRIRLQGQPGVYGPELAHVIPIRKIAMAAQRHRLIKSVRLIGWRLTTVVVLAALAVGVVGAVVSAITSNSVTSTSITLRLVIFSVITVTATMIGKLAAQLIYPNFRENTLTKVIDDLKALEKEPVSDQYRAFVDELTMMFGRLSQFRCVIVDDYCVLDRVTRMVLDNYLRHQADEQRSELWVIFYPVTDKSLEVEIERQMRNKPYGHRRIKLYQQDPLTEPQRRLLAEAWQVPERYIFRTIRAIIQDPSGLVYLDDLFGQAYRERRGPASGQRAADILDLFYLIAINASCGGNPWLYERDILANFSRERGLRARVLQALLPGRALSRATLSAELGKMRMKFFPRAGEIAGESGQRRLRATAEAGEILEGTEAAPGKWADFELASPGLAHLFWVLYWSDTKLNGAPDAFFLQEIVTHLLRSAIPAELDTGALGQNFPRSALAKELFEVAMQCLAACLRYCLLDDVPELLDRAKALAEDAGREESRRRRRRLRRLAWQAYELLGDESVLSVALDLEPVAAAAAEQDGQPVLLDLFLDSTPDATAERRQSIRRELTRTDGGRSVSSYATVRASWLAASVQPFFCPGTPALSAAATGAHEVLPGMLTTAISALDSAVQDDEWRAADILGISLGVWALTISTCRDWSFPDDDSAQDRHAALTEILNDCYVLADDLAQQRRQAEPDAASLDLVADCLAEDLLAVVFAAGLALLVHWPEFSGHQAAGWSDVAHVVIESGHSLGIRVPIALADEGSTVEHAVITDAARCMGVLAMLWRSLGFRQQASFMTIRYAQFLTLALTRSPSLADQVIQLLSADLEAADHIGLLALFAAADGARFSDQLASQILVRYSATARDGGFGDRLVTEISYLTLNEAHTYQMGLADSLEFLVGRCPGAKGAAGTRLDPLLADIEDDSFGHAALVLINSMLAVGDQTIVERVRAALDRRIAKVEDAETATAVSAYLRIFDVQQLQRAGQPIDVTAELDAWTEMKDEPTYAFILSLLLGETEKKSLDRIFREALQILPDTETYLENTGYVYLAYNLLRMKAGGRSVTPEDMKIINDALRIGALSWQRSLSADLNIKLFRYLAVADSKNSSEYIAHQIQWERVALELDVTERLPRMVDQGRFFLLIWHYYSFFYEYGLRSEPSMSPGGLTEPELSQELARWRKNRNEIPDPVRLGPGSDQDAGAARLSGEFLARGYALFFPPAADAKQRQALDAELEESRHKLDQKAKGAIEMLYRMLRSLPRLPQTVEHILGRHQDLVLARIDGQGTDSRSVA